MFYYDDDDEYGIIYWYTNMDEETTTLITTTTSAIESPSDGDQSITLQFLRSIREFDFSYTLIIALLISILVILFLILAILYCLRFVLFWFYFFNLTGIIIFKWDICSYFNFPWGSTLIEPIRIWNIFRKSCIPFVCNPVKLMKLSFCWQAMTISRLIWLFLE